MNVSITPELEGFVQEKVASGRYRSASEVVRAGLRLLERQDLSVVAPAPDDPRLHPPTEGPYDT